MTENQEEGADSTRTPDEDQQEQQQKESGGNEEAAKYRRRLREVEAERDQLAEQVQGFRQADVERRAADALQDPSDVWRAGVQLNDVLDENSGELDEDKLAETIKQVTEEHPGWRKRLTGFDEDQGRKSDGSTVAPSWAEMLRSPSRST